MNSKKLTLRELALLAVLGAMTFAAKMVLAGFPHIEPVSLLVMLFAVCIGWQGLYAVAVYVALELAMWGWGLWSFCYLYVWLILFCLARLLRNMEHPLGWAILSGGFGLSFGALCAPVSWISGGWAAAISWWISGIPADLIHCGGNFLISLLLFRPLRKLLTRLVTQYNR